MIYLKDGNSASAEDPVASFPFSALFAYDDDLPCVSGFVETGAGLSDLFGNTAPKR